MQLLRELTSSFYNLDEVVVAAVMLRPGARERVRAISSSGDSSYKGHAVDALAVRGDEGRRSLRKAPGSGQARDDPEVSEWGNPAR